MALQVLSEEVITNAVGPDDYAALTDNGTGTLEQAEQSAIGEIRSMLAHRFEIDAALAATPVEPKLRRILIDMCLFEAYKVFEPRNIPDLRVKANDMARSDLKAWGNGSVHCPLPRINDTAKGRGRIAYGKANTPENPSKVQLQF